MSTVIVNQTITADGYAAGIHQTEERPFGEDGGDGWGNRLHGWMFDQGDENRAEVEQMAEAAGDGEISIQGGANTINQYLAAGLVDELRLHIVPFTLGAGARLFDGVPALDLERVSARVASTVIHVTYRVLP
ncbi:dihydrofolate reductase family protein [Leifsonia sp. Le1]|uniref:dihydrofolate reductase family protein n=1 Tax=Leifsonia sp. Le1 TaxID=3404918 RepID=UPI003EBF6E0A